jgi:hypothetical protein
MIELPPLPYGASPAYGYTEAEMRAYGEACARTALEGCAKNCDSIAYELKNPTDPFGSFDAGVGGWVIAERCAAAIRALTSPSSPSSSQTRS